MDKHKQGKQNRAKGQRFELLVRQDLELKGWIVSRWINNVGDYPENNINLPPEEREDRKLVPAKRGRFGLSTTGFPDFIAYRLMRIELETIKLYEVRGIEVKSNGYLTKEEKEKIEWLLDNQIFAIILIAKKGKKGGIIYKEFI